jgi:hypothetical protein
VIVTAPDRLREQLRGLSTGKLLDRCSRLRRTKTAGVDELATRPVLRSLAHRIEAATLEAGQLEGELLGNVRALVPAPLDEPGVGPIVAAQLIVAWSHRGRMRSEACFARLAGSCPDPRLQRPDRPAPALAVAATDNSTAHCTRSSCTNATQQPRTTSPDASPMWTRFRVVRFLDSGDLRR